VVDVLITNGGGKMNNPRKELRERYADCDRLIKENAKLRERLRPIEELFYSCKYKFHEKFPLYICDNRELNSWLEDSWRAIREAARRP
jgi:hypothetical protein